MTLPDERPLPEANNVTRYIPVIDNEILTYRSKTRKGINSRFGMSMVKVTNENGVWG